MIVAVVFWACIAAAVTLSGVGLTIRSPRVLFVAAALQIPLALYLAATPRFRWFGLLLPVPQVVAGLVVRRSRWLAVVLSSFFACFVVWLEIVVFQSNQRAAV
jgi:hypothetical protein